MKAMKFAEFASTGAVLMSVFHQLSAGKTGSGGAIGAPWTGRVAGHCCACAVQAHSRNNKPRVADAGVRMSVRSVKGERKRREGRRGGRQSRGRGVERAVTQFNFAGQHSAPGRQVLLDRVDARPRILALALEPRDVASRSKASPRLSFASSDHASGTATGAPSRARSEYDATAVAPRPLRR